MLFLHANKTKILSIFQRKGSIASIHTRKIQAVIGCSPTKYCLGAVFFCILKNSIASLSTQRRSFRDSVLKNLDWLSCLFHTFDNTLRFVMTTLETKLLFLKSFICFATVQGVEGKGLIDLLTHAEFVALKAARLISICWFDRNNKQMCNEMEFQISQLIREEIDPVDPQVRETYIHVLAASKLSRSSHTLALEKNKHLLGNFIDCLLYNVMELLEHFPSFSVLVKDQMLILHEGVRFLSVLLGQQQEKFDGLHDQMKDLIGFVACHAGIVILSLSATEMIEGLAKETDLVPFHLVKVLKFISADSQ